MGNFAQLGSNQLGFFNLSLTETISINDAVGMILAAGGSTFTLNFSENITINDVMNSLINNNVTLVIISVGEYTDPITIGDSGIA